MVPRLQLTCSSESEVRLGSSSSHPCAFGYVLMSPRLVSALQLHTDSSAGTQRYAVQENDVLSGHEFQPIAYDEPIRA